jgi:integrase
MRKRHQTGGLKKQRGKWLGQWWVGDKRQSVVLGLIKDMTKGQARKRVARIVTEENAKRQADRAWKFGEFVEQIFFPFFKRKWKSSTASTVVQRISFHLVGEFGGRELKSFRRDELQDLLDRKAKTLSFSVVDHLKWDLNSIFNMAEAEGQVDRNPARLLFTPKEAAKPVRRAMSMKEVQICFSVLGNRERLIAKLAVLAGMRPGEIFGLRWPQLTATYADIRQRVYRNVIDTPKTDQSLRKAALSKGLLQEIETWRAMAVDEERLGFSVGKPDAALEGQLLATQYASPARQGRTWLGKFFGDAADPRNFNEGARGGWEAGRRSARP